MARGIIIFGSSGSGKTTLGKLAAEKLDFPYFDIDDYI
jgi:shikimate kinase